MVFNIFGIVKSATVVELRYISPARRNARSIIELWSDLGTIHDRILLRCTKTTPAMQHVTTLHD